MQTAVPKPDFMAMTPATLHARSAPAAKPSPSPSPTPKKPHHTPDGWYIPVISLVAPDLTSAGTRQFFTSTSDIPGLLTTAVLEVVKQLYTTPANQPQLPETIALHVRPMRGVAYTTGDAAHKEIHLSADYVGGLEAGAAAAREIEGVVLHEMVHVWQCDGGGTAPGGLVEGLADWVRLRGGYAPEHWSRGGEAWDDG